ncbi:protein disulfide isomerase-like 5-2 [Striga asiatica]|uniref:Protein disulfide isomerase-like 5-2 n=1 Tax=Striga asiatica TaxID=4170 RepID=A0A5A7P482_STRAF|nr:protein disulfide isomerase-like 5-2 [Striga asiatica]
MSSLSLPPFCYSLREKAMESRFYPAIPGISDALELPEFLEISRQKKFVLVIGSDSIDEADMGNQVSKFLEGYREGSVIQKRISGPSLMEFIASNFAVKIFLIFLFVLLVMILILATVKDEPQTVDTRVTAEDRRTSASQTEARDKED